MKRNKHIIEATPRGETSRAHEGVCTRTYADTLVGTSVRSGAHHTLGWCAPENPVVRTSRSAGAHHSHDLHGNTSQYYQYVLPEPSVWFYQTRRMVCAPAAYGSTEAPDGALTSNQWTQKNHWLDEKVSLVSGKTNRAVRHPTTSH